jgi:hypothetical protein
MLVGYLDIGSKDDLQAKFSSSCTAQTSLLQNMEPVESLPNHPKSCIGCIK